MLTRVHLTRAEEAASVIITAVRVNSSKEYVEITNVAADTVVDGWKLEYRNASGSNIKTLSSLSGEMAAGTTQVFASTDFLASLAETDPNKPLLGSLAYNGMADGGGNVRLYRAVAPSLDYPDGFALVDTVAWTSASTLPEDREILSMSGSVAAKRCTDSMGVYRNTDSNQADFYLRASDQLFVRGERCDDIVDPDDDEEEEPVEVTSCEGLIVSELLPNPAGTDTNNEFIELYNPTNAPISLKGCYLLTSSSSKNFYAFGDDDAVPAGAFFAYRNLSAQLVLPNASAVDVALVSANDETLQSIHYADDLDDDQTWALDGGDFRPTYRPTPGATNVIIELRPCDDGYMRSTATGYCQKIVDETEPTPCPDGYFRKPETGRCNKVTASSQAFCPVGQVRNPETNRCRSVLVPAIQLTPCKEGQERNPETNRCRTVVSTSDLVECKPGQVRNPETNRCRTVVAGASTINGDPIVDIQAEQVTPANYLAGLAVLGVALSYAVYEWRQEIATRLVKLVRRRAAM